MPHISIEATPVLGASLDFVALFGIIHRRLAEKDYAILTDLKSRVHITDCHLAGEDRAAEFVVARLMTTNPRPEAEQLAMARIVHDVLRGAIEELQPSMWWQCCVFNEPFRKVDYIRTDSQA